MRRIDGTATISIEELDKLRECEKWYNELAEKVRGLVAGIDAEKYAEECKKIDEIKEISDKELRRRVKIAQKTMSVIVSEHCLRSLIREYINDEESEYHCEISEMSEVDFKEVELNLNTGQQVSGKRGQRER